MNLSQVEGLLGLRGVDLCPSAFDLYLALCMRARSICFAMAAEFLQLCVLSNVTAQRQSCFWPLEVKARIYYRWRSASCKLCLKNTWSCPLTIAFCWYRLSSRQNQQVCMPSLAQPLSTALFGVWPSPSIILESSNTDNASQEDNL